MAEVLKISAFDDLRRCSITAIIDDRVVTFESVEQKFEKLAQIWRKFNRGKSVINYGHFAYFQVVALGWAVVPLLLREVATGNGTWYVALQYIVGDMPEAPEVRGDPVAVRAAWLEWGRRHGYRIEPEEASGID